ncbi:MAG: hypothetical protein ABII22_02400 [Candidatus Micrarchaeota archaeon]
MDMMLIAYLVIALIAGFLVKLVDHIEDETKHKSKIKYPLAIAYGLLIGFLISNSPFSTLFIAALFAQVFAMKIDCKGHVLGFFVAIASTFIYGVPYLDPAIFAFFWILAMLDEVEWMGKFAPLANYRPFLKMGALVFVFAGNWDYLFGILAFDIGYIAAIKTYSKKVKLKF